MSLNFTPVKNAVQKLNPAKSVVDLQQVIGPASRTGRNVVIINSVELNILLGKNMPIEPRDYLSGAAIVLSLASFLVALRSASFNRRVKAAELRAQVLMKYTEAKNQASSLRTYYSNIRREAEESNDIELFKLVNHDDKIARITKRLEEYYERVEQIPTDRGVKVYESLFHDMHDILADITSLKATAESEVAAHKARKIAVKPSKKNA